METALIGTLHETERLILNQKGNLDSGTFHIDMRTKMRYYLETISFWKEEVLFFTELLEGLGYAGKNKNRRSEVLKNLNKIHGNLLKSLENEIIALEKSLSVSGMGPVLLSSADVRKRHDGLRKSGDSFTTNFGGFQRIAFKYLRQMYTKEAVREE